MFSNDEFMDLLLSLGELTLKYNNEQIIHITRKLLMLLPSGKLLIVVFSCYICFSQTVELLHKWKMLSGVFYYEKYSWFSKAITIFFGKDTFQTVYLPGGT